MLYRLQKSFYDSAMAERTIKLTVSYDGLDYSGWQNQPGKRTIQAELEQAVSELTGFYTRVKGASRTDAGVSALGQVVSFTIDSPIPTENFLKALNSRLPRDIRVVNVAEVKADFEPSSCAKKKHYRYVIFTGKTPNVLKTRNVWHRPSGLNVIDMDRAAKMLVGQKDFKSFANVADNRKSTVRTIFRADVTQDGQWIYFDVEGDGFLYNMVRNIVGTLVEIGRGRWPAEKITEILIAKDRTAAGPIAPPEGLCLMNIQY